MSKNIEKNCLLGNLTVVSSFGIFVFGQGLIKIRPITRRSVGFSACLILYLKLNSNNE